VVKQGIRTAKLSTDDPAIQQKVVDEVLKRLQGASLDVTPARLSQVAYAAAREVTGVADPFAEAKHETNLHALELLPDLRDRIAASEDPLHAAVKVALIGNAIDLGIGHRFDIERDVDRILKGDLTVDDTKVFRRLLTGCRKLLFLCDNSGEIAFDRLLIELLKDRCEVVASVKSGPIINDATRQDAEEVGLTDVVPVIETGSDRVGVDWDTTSLEFAEAFHAADLILAKGQGNFETLDEVPEEILFLLKAKCPEVARELGVREGDTVFVRNRGRKA